MNAHELRSSEVCVRKDLPRPQRQSSGYRATRFALTLIAFGQLSCVTTSSRDSSVGEPYRFENLTSKSSDDEIFVIASFSGGGTRAAALAYGVLMALNSVTIERAGDRQTLLEEVDVISSVSGGSFPAAYLAVHGRQKFINHFRGDFLEWNLQRRLWPALVSPRVLFSPRYSRIDYAADLYDKRLFHKKTFADAKKRPFVIINATDMARGSQFSFTDEQFGAMCRDLRSYPIARAVAASSAFPVLLAPLLEGNAGGSCSCEPSAESKLSKDKCAATGTPSGIAAQYADHCSYFDNLASYRHRGRFLHLLDGGVADNLGLRPIVRSLQRRGGDFSLPMAMKAREGSGAKIVLLVVNARTEGKTSIDTTSSTPPWWSVLSVATGTPMASFSSESVSQLLDRLRLTKTSGEVRPCADWFVSWKPDTDFWMDDAGRRTGGPAASNAPPASNEPCKFPVYVVDINFASPPKRSGNSPSPEELKWPPLSYEERKKFLDMPTSLRLRSDDIDFIIKTSKQLLFGNPEFHALEGAMRDERVLIRKAPN